MKPEHRSRNRFPVTVALKVPSKLAEAIHRQARADDRSVSSYLRRLLEAVMPEQQEETTR
jgi:hypothetical protein